MSMVLHIDKSLHAGAERIEIRGERAESEAKFTRMSHGIVPQVDRKLARFACKGIAGFEG